MSEYDPFAAIYDQWSAHMTEDVPFYVALAREADGPIVELAVGTGRVAIPVATETGKPVIGVDLSPAMLAVARERATEARVDLDLRLQDMRDLKLDEPAALVYSPFRSVLHMPTWADKRRVFEGVTASLQPGGRFAWNAFVFDHEIASRLHGQHQEEPLPHTVTQVPHESRVDIELDSGAAISLWWATRNEWLGLIDVAGLEVEALYGDFERGAFDEDSREFVWVARKPG
jgi:ubiquinone/menaquinone biosynthesis C-methylase UbiE